MQIALTADLHVGHGKAGDDATAMLAEHLRDHVPDLVILAGDLGTGDRFQSCLAMFDALPCPKALVPGNHDIWVDDDSSVDSLALFRERLPTLAHEHGFHFLDHGPMLFPEMGLAVVGTMNWYDYSWSLDRMKAEVPNWQWHLENKSFTRGRHNDRRFVRWVMDDVSFTRQLVEMFEKNLETSLSRVDKALIVTHHPACREVSFPREEPAQGLDGLLWDALSGNRRLEEILETRLDRLAGVFSGHTHRAVSKPFHGVPAQNIGGDYHFKRLLTWNWPDGVIEQHIFGDPNRARHGG